MTIAAAISAVKLTLAKLRPSKELKAMASNGHRQALEDNRAATNRLLSSLTELEQTIADFKPRRRSSDAPARVYPPARR